MSDKPNNPENDKEQEDSTEQDSTEQDSTEQETSASGEQAETSGDAAPAEDESDGKTEAESPDAAVPAPDRGGERFPDLERAPTKSTGRGMYAALVATVGVAAFFAGLSVPVLNQDPVTMSDLDQALLFLEDKIDQLSGDLQKLEDTMLTDPNAPAPQSQPVITADDDPVLGSVDAPVTMIEFSDFQCPFCARFYSETLPLIKANFIDTGLVKMVYRDFPLQSIHPNAIPAAVASECADEQGAYWEYHDILFEDVSAWGPMEISGAVEQFKAYAEDLGLDTGTFSECVDTGKYVTEVTDDYADGVAYGVTGTPAFFLGSEQTGYFPISGARPYPEFQFAIEQILGAISQ